MKLLLSCPKCEKSLQVDAALSGSQTDCPDCGQRFIVGQAGSQLPVVEPQAIIGPSAMDAQPSAERTAAFPKRQGEAHDLKRGMEAETKGRFIRGTMPAGASFQRRKCAECGSPMSISHGENHFLDFLLPLGNAVYWGCERCGNEVKLQSPRRIFLMLLASPLIIVWWFVFTESSRQHDAERGLVDQGPGGLCATRFERVVLVYLVPAALCPGSAGLDPRGDCPAAVSEDSLMEGRPVSGRPPLAPS